MYSNNKLILQVLSLMKAFNINKVVISSGTRHFPLIHSLEADNFFKLYSVVDERSAAFFALGLIQSTGDPVVICCTSGSAITNYGSAVSEAYYQHLPLLLITVDRIPELLGQNEDQMIKQDNIFHEFIKYHGQLPVVNTKTDEWYVNRIINEAFIELNHHGRGPVQINFPILEHNTDTFQTQQLPEVRKIAHHPADMDEGEWATYIRKLTGKNVMIIWGQSVSMSVKLQDAVDHFCKRFNCVIFTDKISNCHHAQAIENAFVVLRAMTSREQNDLLPDIVISIGGNYVFNNEIKKYLKLNENKFEHWQVGEESLVCDPFHRLTEMFEMKESTFFSKISERLDVIPFPISDYFTKWKKISESVEEPSVAYSELYAIGKLLKALPDHVVLQLANSNTIRMGHLFHFSRSVQCFCNRGVNGIDGCMSTAVGYATESERLVFHVIGDLAFFYDMNALWNRHLSQKLRVLLINNEGGSVIHMAFNKKIGQTLSAYTSAGHRTSAKGWVESLGIKYISATNQKEVDEGIQILTDTSANVPMLLEVFTNKEEDALILKQYFAKINRITLAERAVRKAKKMASEFLTK